MRFLLKGGTATKKHKRHKYFSYLCVFCASLWLIPFFASGQPQESIALTDFPVPSWPAEGTPAPKDKYVFVDLEKNEYVIAYPANLGTPAFEKDGPGSLKTARYELQRNVDPAVTVEVTRSSPAKLTYAYTVMNRQAAKQSIDQWLLVVPLQAGNDSIKYPAGWFGIVQKGRTFKLKNPEWIRNGAASVWSFGKDTEVIQPGASKKGFQIESELRPGFTVAYFCKAESVSAAVATSGNVPKAVKDQLDSLLTIEYNSKTLLTIGPKFQNAVDDRTVALDFIEGINALGRGGTLDPNSEFVKSTLGELKGISPGGGAPVKLTAQARTPVETEVLNALKAALRIN
jgi:hypothetical protein